MAGSAGIGKSTLARHIGATLRQRRTPVDIFGEEELFTRPEFSRVAEGFRTQHHASPQVFEAAYETWLSALGAGTVAVMDWNPAGMAGDLPWATADRARFGEHLQAVRAVAGERLLLLHLLAPADITIDRARRERGEEWLARSDQIAQSGGHLAPDRIGRIAAEADRHAAQTREELGVAAEAGWPIVTVDAANGPDDVHDRAIAVIDTQRTNNA